MTKQITNLDELRHLASIGLTERQISSKLGMCWSTFKKKRDENPDIEEAFQKGRADGIADVANSLKEQAMKGNVAAQKFYLINRDRSQWADRVEQTQVGFDGGAVKTEHTITFRDSDDS